MRKEANTDGNETMKFISYSNVDINLANNAKLSQGSMSPTSPGGAMNNFKMSDK
jgi:hypothetical protein